MSRLLGPLLLKNRRFWGWFVPKKIQWLHFLFSVSVIWWTAFWVICPWNEFEETEQCETGCQCLLVALSFWSRIWFSKKKTRCHNLVFHQLDSLTGKVPLEMVGYGIIQMWLCKLFGPFWKFWAAYWAHLLASRTDKTRHDTTVICSIIVN